MNRDDREDVSRDVDDEVRYHIERKVEKLLASGMSERDARLEAERRFGDVDRIKKGMTQMSKRRQTRRRVGEAWDQLRMDVAYALRRLVRSPGFTAVTALTLTLGIGATTAVFSLVDGILFRPLPFEKPEELVAVWSDYTRQGGPVDEWPNFPNLWGLREQSRQLDAVGIRIGSNATLTGLDGPAESLRGVLVSYDMFALVLRVEPALGRIFSQEDDKPGAPVTVILSHGLWTRAFGADPGIVGKAITLNGRLNEVIGVMPADFSPPPILATDIWRPLRMDMSDHACGMGGACMHGIGRLAEGATFSSAAAEADQIAARQEAAAPEANAGVGWNLQPLQDDLVSGTRAGLLVLLGTAGFVLLMACVNQASLLLARGTERRGELAIRSAIGAGRRRIVSQLIVESMTLALMGGLLGVAVAYLLTDLLVALAPAGTPRIAEVAVNGRVLVFATVITALAGLLVGVFPALSGTGNTLQASLQEGGRGDPRSAGVRVRQSLVAAQVALALVLLAGSALLIRSFQNLREVDLGFRPEGVLTFRLNLPVASYASEDLIIGFQRDLVEKLRALPAVTDAAVTSSLPLAGLNTDRGFILEGRPVPPPNQSQAVWFQGVTPAYLETMGSRIVRGRWISDTDDPPSPQVVVINEAFAQRYFPTEEPIGRRISFNGPTDPVWLEIVGVAADVKHFGIRDDARASLYLPFTHLRPQTMFFVVRSEGDPGTLATGVRSALAATDDELAASQIAPLNDFVRDTLSPERFVSMLVGLFAVVALVLAVVGLYGVVSYNVNARMREMGVRLVLGASGSELIGMVIRRSMTVVAIGLAVGLAGSALLTRFLETLLYDVEAADPMTFMLATALLGGAAFLASLLPARRAATVAPSEVLRDE